MSMSSMQQSMQSVRTFLKPKSQTGSKEETKITANSLPISRSGGVVTGVPGWEEHSDNTTGRLFFVHTKKKKRSWGLPLRDVLKDPHMKGPSGDDDWECHIDPKTMKRFFVSKMYKKRQWKVPHIYVSTIGSLVYFQEDYIKERLKIRNHKILNLQNGVTSQEIMGKVTLSDALSNNYCCAAFHRFLVASYAEENLLFYGAIETFNNGEWKGMKALGAEMKNALSGDLEDEGVGMLQQQLIKTRASTRMGMQQKPKTLKQEAEIIYNKFMKENSDLWVCVSESIRKDVLNQITAADDVTDLRGIFDVAKTQVYESMIDELYPRFIQVAVEEDHINDFETDEILKANLIDIGGFSDKSKFEISVP